MGNLLGKSDRYVGGVFLTLALCLFALPVSGQTDELLTAPEDYITEGVPPIKKSDVNSLFFDQSAIRSNLIWDADVKNRRFLVTDEANEIHLLESPLSKPVRLIEKVYPLSVKINPNGRNFVYLSDHEDEENSQVYLYDFATKTSRKLTVKNPSDETINSVLWNQKGTAIFYSRVDYDSKTSRLCSNDLNRETCFTVELKGNWDVLFTDSRRILLKNWKSSSSQHLFIFDTKSQKLEAIDEQGNSRRAFIVGERIYWTSDGNTKCLREPCILTRQLRTGVVTQLNLPEKIGSIQDIKVSPGGGRLLVHEGKDGIDILHVLGLHDGRVTREFPAVVPPSFVVWHTRWLGADELAYTIEHVGKPASLHSFDFKKGRYTDWTKEKIPAELAGKIDTPAVVRWKSFDQKEITGFVVRPKERKSKSPVVIFVHGGPMVLDRPVFNGEESALVTALGITVIHTNIRGSSGFGRAFLESDNQEKRGDAINDVRALIDWIEKQPDLDAERIFIRGQSYGGFVALGTALAEPARVKGVIAEYPLVSIRGLLSMSWINDSAITEYGDPKNESLMRTLDALSPLNNTAKWNSGIPVLLTRGKLDERNPEQNLIDLKNQLRERGSDVWFIYSNKSGHGFGGDYVTAAIHQFLRKKLN